MFWQHEVLVTLKDLAQDKGKQNSPEVEIAGGDFDNCTHLLGRPQPSGL